MDVPSENHLILNIYSNTMIFMLKLKKYGKLEKNSIDKYYLILMILFNSDYSFYSLNIKQKTYSSQLN